MAKASLGSSNAPASHPANACPAPSPVAYASLLALMVGAITLLAGALELGFMAEPLSKPTQIGCMNGLALTIVVGQLPKLFGFSVDAQGLIGEVTGFVRALAGGATVAAPGAPLVPSSGRRPRRR